MNYTIRILQNAKSKKYHGEVIINGRREIETLGMAAEIIAIRQLNNKIREYNALNDVNLPYFPEAKGAPPLVSKEPDEPVETVEAVEQPKPKRQARKPFTPYGLNGYLVDKQGNIRLMLDRKANAHTIVLEPEMFNALAEMVRKTQAQAEQAA